MSSNETGAQSFRSNFSECIRFKNIFTIAFQDELQKSKAGIHIVTVDALSCEI